jgi:GH24 family phage-related lysozyme (muramidase)
MKLTQEQIDESVKNLVMALLATTMAGGGIKYAMDKFNASDEPLKNKIKAVEQAKELSNDSEFDNTMNAILQKYSPNEPIKPKAILVKPLKRYDIQPDLEIDDFRNFIMPSEIYGNSLQNPKNKKFLKPYQDDAGLWTIGIGHLIGRGSYSDMENFVKRNGPSISMSDVVKMFDKDVIKHMNLAKRKFGNQWDSFSPELKKALVDISFRGDLFKPNSKDDFNFVKQIKRGEFENASKTYLIHKEYKKRISEGGEDGVVKRMNRNSKIIADESSKFKKGRTL